MTEEKSILDKAKELATDIKDKVTDLVGENEDKITGAIDKTGEFVDDKTKGKYTEKIDKAQEAAKSAVSKVAGTDKPGGGDVPGTGPGGPDVPEGGPTDPIPDA
jgi:uncharacterized protein YjbJ (UPF0337 family)